MGYCPFSSLSHDTMDCIVTQGAGACSRGPRHGQEALRHGRPARGASGSARAWPGRWGVSRYKRLYRDRRERPGVATQRNSTLRHGAMRARHGSQHTQIVRGKSCIATQ